MPNPTASLPQPAPAPPTGPHGELDCADAEALLAEAYEQISDLRSQVDDLTRRLENACAQKSVAIDEAVMLRSSHP